MKVDYGRKVQASKKPLQLLERFQHRPRIKAKRMGLVFVTLIGFFRSNDLRLGIVGHGPENIEPLQREYGAYQRTPNAAVHIPALPTAKRL